MVVWIFNIQCPKVRTNFLIFPVLEEFDDYDDQYEEEDDEKEEQILENYVQKKNEPQKNFFETITEKKQEGKKKSKRVEKNKEVKREIIYVEYNEKESKKEKIFTSNVLFEPKVQNCLKM